jgi:hypothetical protein
MADAPLCLLLLTRPLESFILRDQAVDLLLAPGVVKVDPPRIPFGALARLPAFVGRGVAAVQAAAIRRRLAGTGRPAVVVMFHPLQEPLARALLKGEPGGELWYSLWDRYDAAYDAGPRVRRRVVALHDAAARESAFTFAVSAELVRLEDDAGRPGAHVVASAADSFPAPELGDVDSDWAGSEVVAVSLGHLGWRTDWELLRAVGVAMPELTLLLIGDWHDDECGEDPDYVACRAAPNLVWLGRRDDAEAARLIQCADVGIVPFAQTPFNNAGLPNRILKYARQGRRTISLPLAGSRTWSNAITFADGPDAFVAALRASAGARDRPDVQLRSWALAQTGRAQNRPLRERLAARGIELDD